MHTLCMPHVYVNQIATLVCVLRKLSKCIKPWPLITTHPSLLQEGNQILLSVEDDNPSALETYMTVIGMLVHYHLNKVNHLTAFIA